MFQNIDLTELGLGTGMDYEDKFNHGHTFAKSGGRAEKWVPAWAADDKKIQLVIYNYLWNYVDSQFARPKAGVSLRELDSVAADIQRSKRSRLSSMPLEYKHNWLVHTASMENGVAATTVRMIYMAYRQRQRNPDIAAELNTTAFAVRTRLWRLNQLARRLFAPEDNFPRHWTAHRRDAIGGPQRLRRLRTPFENHMLENFAQRYNAGTPLSTLAAESGCAPATIWWRLKRTPGFKPRLKPDLSRTAFLQAVERYNAGETLPELSKAYDRSEGTMWSGMNATGLLVRKGHGAPGRRHVKRRNR
jgi:hypothetical protein